MKNLVSISASDQHIFSISQFGFMKQGRIIDNFILHNEQMNFLNYNNKKNKKLDKFNIHKINQGNFNIQSPNKIYKSKSFIVKNKSKKIVMYSLKNSKDLENNKKEHNFLLINNNIYKKLPNLSNLEVKNKEQRELNIKSKKLNESIYKVPEFRKSIEKFTKNFNLEQQKFCDLLFDQKIALSKKDFALQNFLNKFNNKIFINALYKAKLEKEKEEREKEEREENACKKINNK